MHKRMSALEPMVDEPAICGAVRACTMGDMAVTHHLVKAGIHLPPGDPTTNCNIRHWGFLVKGEMKVSYADGTAEIITAGETFHLPAGHRIEHLADSEFIQFSPSHEMN